MKVRTLISVLVSGLFRIAEVNAVTVTYVYTDAQGTPLAEADSTGRITATFDYRPFGMQVLGSSVEGVGYTGHVSDSDVNLIYMQARYYDPIAGRFISVDPKSEQWRGVVEFGRYHYADNDPVKNIDPDGRDTEVSMMFHTTQFGLGLGYHHEFVVMRDTDTGTVVIARGGPSGNYPLVNGISNSKADQAGLFPLTGQKPMTLQAYVGPLQGSAEEGQPNKPLAGSQVVLKTPFAEVVKVATNIGNAVNEAQIPYQPQSTNSNAFANTVYQSLTGAVPPNQENAAGSGTKLQYVLKDVKEVP